MLDYVSIYEQEQDTSTSQAVISLLGVKISFRLPGVDVKESLISRTSEPSFPGGKLNSYFATRTAVTSLNSIKAKFLPTQP